MKRPNNFILSVLCGLAFCFAFTSCENFLDGQNIKDQIIEEIEIANTNPTTFYVEADEGSGTVNPSQLRLKKNETFDVMFKPAESWQFIKWEVVDRETKEPVSGIIKFENETALETKGKLLNPKDNLEIHPKAILLPAVTEVIPSSTGSIPANQPVIITFNMPMEDEGVTPENSIFNFDNINITNNGSSISHLFQKPVFDSSKTVLTIRPNASALKNYITEQNKENIDVKISLSETIRVQIEEETLSLVQNEKSAFIIRYNKTVETSAPVDYGFFVTAKNISLNDVASFDQSKKFVINTNLTTDEDILKNRNGGTVYIYGKYYDEDSGVGKIRVVEKRTNNKDGYTVSEQPRQTDFYISNQNIVYSTEDNYTSFILKYTMQDSATQDHKDGAIRLDVTVYDNSENAAPVKSLTAIKDSFIDLTDVELYNFNESPFPSSTADEINGDYLTNYYDTDSEPQGRYSPFKPDFYEENLKVVKLRSLHKKVYANTCLPDNDLTVSVTYLGNTELMNYDQNNSKWKLPLQVNNIANLSLRLKILDSNGISSEKDFVFPPDPKVVVGLSEYNYPSGYLQLESGLNITGWNEFCFRDWDPAATSENMIPGPFCYFRRAELLPGYASNIVVPNGSSNGVFFIYQNKGLWGNRCDEWFSYVSFATDNNIPRPHLLSAQKRRSNLEGKVSVVVTIDASDWDQYDYDYIGIYKGTIDPGREDTSEKRRQRLEYSFVSTLQGLIERGETSCVIETDLFMDYVNIHTYYSLRGIKGDSYSVISDQIRVKGINSESEAVQHELLNIKPEIMTRQELYQDVIVYPQINGYHHGSQGENTIYYKGAVNGCECFYPFSLWFRDTRSFQEEWYYYSYGGDSVIVKMNGATYTYNYNDIACRYDDTNYYGDSSYNEAKAEEYYQLIIPLLEMDSDNNELDITVTTNCGTSVNYSTNWERKTVPKFKDFSSDSFIYSDLGHSNNYQSGEWMIIVNKFNKTSGSWENYNKINSDPTYSSSARQFRMTKPTLPSQTFIKVITKAAVSHGDDSYWDTHYSDPVYHWTGTKSSGDETDFLLEQNDFYLVGSDQPVLLHVISTKQPYETCKNWDAEKWERNHRILSEKQLIFNSSNSGSKKYKPVLTGLSHGDCYVVVAHFADDHVEMSQVKQMP